MMKLNVFIHTAEEGGYWVEIPVLPGCISEGETYEEAMANIIEAAKGWLAVAIEHMPDQEQVQIAEIEL
ncbi:type II toxin-antitoxin system HicB family antitoxin [Chromatium okenii]|uniref:type II toxin-antitoxin system HicB family antitoxin n=1 Tax=Chromatium okenii TaxID=61644 RepID=UPI001905E91A|nr:type II toxin-antitoxin system HicB family antitoxin [Chromatium okenii]